MGGTVEPPNSPWYATVNTPRGYQNRRGSYNTRVLKICYIVLHTRTITGGITVAKDLTGVKENSSVKYTKRHSTVFHVNTCIVDTVHRYMHYTRGE